jgi:hypothetical protein
MEYVSRVTMAIVNTHHIIVLLYSVWMCRSLNQCGHAGKKYFNVPDRSYECAIEERKPRNLQIIEV